MSSPPGESRARLPESSRPESIENKEISSGALIPLLILVLCFGGGCSGALTDDARAGTGAPLPVPSENGGFTDVTLAAGITARHSLPGRDLENIVDAVGAGAAFADLDGDGWLDLAVLGGPRSPEDGKGAHHAGFHVYRNLGNGRFADITTTTGIPADTSAVAVAVGDIDGDGDRDLYLVDRGPNRLYRNRGDARFEEITGIAGVGDSGFGVGAVFLDIENDGDLDLYVTNSHEYNPEETGFYAPEGFPSPLAYSPEPDVLYRNRGDGTFEDISAQSGVADLMGRGMSLATSDVDDDGDTDIFIANDATQNFLLLNAGDGRFTEAGFASGLAMGENGEQTSAMAGDVGDVDLDGQLDIMVSDTAFGAFYRRVQPGFFIDEVMRSGLALLCGQYVSWGQNLIDYDNDGDLDLFVVNGGMHHLVGWEDLLLSNDGTGRFEDAADLGGPYFRSRHVGRSSISGDYDNDGDVDLFVTTLKGRHFLLRNDFHSDHSWLTLDLAGIDVRDQVGARVEVHAGGRTLVGESRGPAGYLGQSDPRIHFGLGPGIDTIDTIAITWPGGEKQMFHDIPARQILTLRRKAG